MRASSLVLAMTLSFAASAEPQKLQTAAYTATVDVKDAVSHIVWRAWFDVPAEKIVARLTSWENAGAFVEKVTAFELRASTKTSATFMIKRKAPVFFIPDPFMVIRATVREHEDGSTQVTWNQVKGSADSQRRTWRVTSSGSGAIVEHESKLGLPIDPPEFMLDKFTASAQRQLEDIRVTFQAKQMLRTPPSTVH